MTNAELLAKIKAEIERRVDILATVSVKQAKDGDSEMSTYYHWKAVSLEELIPFLSNLESEKPMNQEGLEVEMDKFFETMPVLEHENIFEDTFKNIARHFYDLGCRRTAEKYDEIEYDRQRAEESVPNDLEEAAWQYAEQEVKTWGSTEPDDKKEVHDDFIAGAEWMAGQGVSYQAVISADKTIPVLPMKDVSDMELDYGDKVIVQIRKKDYKK